MPSLIRRALEAPLRLRFIFVSLLLVFTVLLLQPYHHELPSFSLGSDQSDIIEGDLGNSEHKPLKAPGDTLQDGLTKHPKRVAIVGAGASGTSAAFFLRRAADVVERRLGVEQGSLLGDVVVYEKEGYVGGRSTTVYPHNDKRLRWQELGASVFVDANKNMMKAAGHFNLTLIDPSYGAAGIGIWDGTQFLFTTSGSDSFPSSWLDSAKALLRYGPLSPMRTKSHVGALVKKFAQLYDPVFLARRGAPDSVEDFAESLGLGRELTTRTGDDWAKAVVKVGDKWLNEVIGGSTRVNYASNVDQIHALGAGVSMAAAGASQIEGGNWQVFQGLLDASGATVHLGTEITEIIPLNNDGELPKFKVVSNKTEINDDGTYDAVFFAAPWHSSPVSKKIAQGFKQPIPPQPYVRLHVTYITTTQPHPSPSFFGLPEGSPVPNTILTTASQAPGVPPARFQSITWHGETLPGSGEYAAKIFSLTRLSDRFLTELLGEEPGWLLRKEWDSYPKLRPISSYAPVEPVKGLHYLAAQESWVSTMETQTIAGREAVARTVSQWWGLGLGECENGDSWDWTC